MKDKDYDRDNGNGNENHTYLDTVLVESPWSHWGLETIIDFRRTSISSFLFLQYPYQLSMWLPPILLGVFCRPF